MRNEHLNAEQSDTTQSQRQLGELGMKNLEKGAVATFR